jgi:hypothetical protein
MTHMDDRPSAVSLHAAPRPAALSAVGLAALVAALHLAVLAGRGGRSLARYHEITPIISTETRPPDETPRDPDRAPSNPTHSYSAGRLALTAGMVIVALAHQVHLMRVGTARAC